MEHKHALRRSGKRDRFHLALFKVLQFFSLFMWGLMYNPTTECFPIQVEPFFLEARNI